MLPLVSSHLCLIHVLIQIFIFQVLRSCFLPSAESRQQYWQQWSRDRGVKLPSLCQKEPGNYSGSGRLFPIKFPGTVWHDHITLLYMCQVGLVRFAQCQTGGLSEWACDGDLSYYFPSGAGLSIIGSEVALCH